MKKQITKLIVGLLIEGPAKRQGLGKLIEKLEEKKQSLESKFSQAGSSEANHKKLRHIIAIERWGQSRLQVSLGSALQEDQSRNYEPAEESSWDDIMSLFRQVRQETLALAKTIQEKALDTSQSVPHNQMGELSLLGWLRYLEVHASVEGRSIKKG